MRTFLLGLCVGWLLMVSAVPGRAQQPTPAGEAAPFLYVYVGRYGESVLPRIVLGLEKPAVKISAFGRCARLSDANPKLSGLAVQLTPDDLKAVVAATKEIAEFKPGNDSPAVILWFTTPDNKALDYLSPSTSTAGKEIFKDGVIQFDSESEPSTVKYLTEKLHPK